MSDANATVSPLKTPGGRAAVALGATVLFAAVLMVALGDDAYLWIKSIHLIAVISWMAGMLYLPRLFVYHADLSTGSETSELFKVMERRLLQIIMTPAMVVTWVLGLWLAWQGSHYSEIWFHVKLLAVIGMTGVHGHFIKSAREFAEDRNTRSSRAWRMINEIPTVLMLVAVVVVIVKPF